MLKENNNSKKTPKNPNPCSYFIWNSWLGKFVTDPIRANKRLHTFCHSLKHDIKHFLRTLSSAEIHTHQFLGDKSLFISNLYLPNIYLRLLAEWIYLILPLTLESKKHINIDFCFFQIFI